MKVDAQLEKRQPQLLIYRNKTLIDNDLLAFHSQAIADQFGQQNTYQSAVQTLPDRCFHCRLIAFDHRQLKVHNRRKVVKATEHHFKCVRQKSRVRNLI
jgi:hypothetical protein